jgi:hypothetical protein
MMVLFNDTWYHEIIERYAPGDADDDTPGSRAVKSLAYANLASACIIAQAIDSLGDAIKDKDLPEELLSRRERFAVVAMQGLLPNPESDKVGFDTIAEMACAAADTLIEHLDGKNGQ